MSEAARADLYTGLSDVLGPQRAETLMAYLPRYDPIEVATKEDLAELRDYMDVRFEAIDQRFDAIDQRFDAIDQRFEAIDGRFSSMDSRFAAIEMRLDGLGTRLDRLFLTLVAGLFVFVSAMVGVLFTTL